MYFSDAWWRFTADISYHLSPVPVLEIFMEGQWHRPVGTVFNSPRDVIATYEADPLVHSPWRILTRQDNIAFGSQELWWPQQGLLVF